jgi:hypothetical protein
VSNQHRVAFADLADADLVVDALYEGGMRGNVSDDPLAKVIGGGNQGGFRYEGSVEPFRVRFCVLYSDLSDPDWPDRLDLERGVFTYYGDNKTPGGDLHATRRQGNKLLREMFALTHAGRRDEVPPIFVFTKGPSGRDVIFRGIAAPGEASVSQSEDLVAIWKTKHGQRFQNYRALFTVLDVPVVSRSWLRRVRRGEDLIEGAPAAWLEWCRSGKYSALAAPRVREYRTPAEQLPRSAEELALLSTIVEHYHAHPDGAYAFERCAAELFRLMQPSAHSIDLTRPWRDGGRDALGLYRIGLGESAIDVEFALEAKCKTPSRTNSSGVRDTARLVARIRHRQFGVFVTTSCIADQAASELVEDGHPVIVMAGLDIVRTLKEHGYGTTEALAGWLAWVDAFVV